MSDEINYKKFAGQGLEDMESGDFSAPWLKILQSLSPELNERDPSYIPGARPGQILSTRSGACYKEVHVIPCKFVFKNVEWKPNRQGFVTSYDRASTPKDGIVNKVTNNLTRPNGNVLQGHAYYLCLIQEENWQPVIIPLKSTGLKAARDWNSYMQARTSTNSYPIFESIYRLTTVVKSNIKGSWYILNIVWSGQVTDTQLFNRAEQTHQIENFLPENLLIAMSQEGGESKNEEEPL